jgi:hypothetical protein
MAAIVVTQQVPVVMVQRKASVKPKHPSLPQMTLTAVETLEKIEKKGVTRQAIAKYIEATYFVNADLIKKLSKTLNAYLESGELKKVGKTQAPGANGRFKLNDKKPAASKAAAKVPTPKKAKAVALPKAPKTKASPKPKVAAKSEAVAKIMKANGAARGRGRPAKANIPSEN